MKTKIGILFVITIFTATFAITSLSTFGTRPSSSEIEFFKASNQYNINKGEFENRRPDLIA